MNLMLSSNLQTLKQNKELRPKKTVPEGYAKQIFIK